jgi:hypothetical protein
VTVSTEPPDRIDIGTTARIESTFFSSRATENQGWRNVSLPSRSRTATAFPIPTSRSI